MTDTGQIPGEGLPESAGAEAGGDPLTAPHPGVPGNGVSQQPGWGTEPMTDQSAPGYTYLDHPAPPGAGLDDEDDVLLMPGPQGSWSDPQPVPPPQPMPPAAPAQPGPSPVPMTSPSQMAVPLPPAVGLPITVEVPVEVPLETVAPALIGGAGYGYVPAQAAASAQAASAQTGSFPFHAVQTGPVPAAPGPQQPLPAAVAGDAAPQAVEGAEPSAPVAAPGVTGSQPVAVPGAAAPAAGSATALPGADGVHPGAPQPALPHVPGMAAAPVAGAEHTPATETGAQPVDGQPLLAASADGDRAGDTAGPYPGAVPAPGEPAQSAAPEPAAATTPPRRPLHMGPPVPDPASGGVSVRSLADRGPAVRASGPPTSGPEYLDVPREDATGIPAQQTGESAELAAPAVGSAWPAAPGGASQQSLIPRADSTPQQENAVPAPSFPAAPAGAAGPLPARAPDQATAPTPAPPASDPAAGPAPEQAQDQDQEQAATPEAAPVLVVPVLSAVAPEAVVPAQGGPVGSVGAGFPAQADGPQFVTVAAGGRLPGDAGPLAPVATAAAAGAPVSAPAPAEAETASEQAASADGSTGEVAPQQYAAPAEEPDAAPVVDDAMATPAADTSVAEVSAADLPAAEAPAQPVPDEAPQAAPPVADEPAQNAVAAPQAPVAAGESVPAEVATEPAAGSAAEPAPVPVPAEAVPAEPLPGKGRRGRRRAAPAVELPEQPAASDARSPLNADVNPPENAPENADADVEPEPHPREAVAQTPAAEAYEPAVRDAVHRVIRERRDIRNGFRSDPIPHDVLLRVLEAAHTAPSVGHSQPWDFVVIRSGKTREKMHELAMQQREAYAKSLPKGRARQFRELKIEAILDTPVNIVVTADPTRGGRHTLGRHTQPQMAPYSSALAVENLWLAARAEGLGVGWVSFFDERQMVAELGLPEHLEVVAYLCVGYVDEFPDEPELMQAGWSQRRPLSWVVHDEEYGNRALPGEQPHDLLEETLLGIRPLDAKALGEAWERQKRMTKPAGALGMLEIISAQLSGLSRQCPPPIPEPAVVAIFAGDHGVHAQGVTSWPQEVTGQMVANFLGGGAVVNAFANQVGAEVCVIDVGIASELPTMPGLLPRKVRMGTADFTTGPAMSREEVLRAIEVGIETARDLVAAGNKALLTGEMGIANTTTSAALIAVYTGVDPAEVTGRGTGINDEMHARKVEVVRRALDLHRPDPADPIAVLSAIGGLEHAAMVGLLLGAAALRTPVILDGVSAGAAALVARAIAPEVLAACIAGHRSAEPGHGAALTTLGLRPLVDLDLRLGEGTGALLALPLVQSAARVMHEVATFDAAGVTEKS
jgi:nicotinate-nucleotide--dimethylbenzimidazole phosphoribosyltransferase